MATNNAKARNYRLVPCFFFKSVCVESEISVRAEILRYPMSTINSTLYRKNAIHVPRIYVFFIVFNAIDSNVYYDMRQF